MRIKQLVKQKTSKTKTLEEIVNYNIEIEGWIKKKSFLCEAIGGTIKNFQKTIRQ